MIRSYLKYLILDKCITILFGGIFRGFMISNGIKMKGTDVNDGHIGKYAMVVNQFNGYNDKGIITKTTNPGVYGIDGYADCTMYGILIKKKGCENTTFIRKWQEIIVNLDS